MTRPSAAACLLALDSATETVHLGLCTPSGAWARALPGGAAASAGLLPAIEALLAEAGIALDALDAIAFGRGPGAFTGLRTVCSVAQGLAVGLDRPLIALDTLAAVAVAAARDGAGPAIWAAQDARMGEVYAARWLRDPAGAWQADEPAALWSPARLLEQVALRPAARAGNAWVRLELLRDSIGDTPVWSSAEPDGAALIELARAAWDRGDRVDPAQALPLYVRDKVALTTAERAAAAAAASA